MHREVGGVIEMEGGRGGEVDTHLQTAYLWMFLTKFLFMTQEIFP